MKRSKESARVFIYGNIVFFISFLIILFFIFLVYLNARTLRDPLPSHLFLKPQVSSGVASTFCEIKTGLIIEEIVSFDAGKGELEFEGLLWFEFDSTRISVDLIDKFVFERGEILYKSDPEPQSKGGGIILIKYLVKVKVKTVLDYSFFPFDNHHIYIVLTNLFLLPFEAVYTASYSDFDIEPNIAISGWNYKGKAVYYGISPVMKSARELQKSHPQVIYLVDLQKKGLGTLLTIIIPLLVMFYISLIAIMRTESTVLLKGDAINWNYSLAIGNLAAILAYRFVIQGLAPNVGYLTIADYLYIYILIVSLISFVFPFASLYIKENYVRFLSKIIPFFCSVVLVFLFYYLLFSRS
jgi:hypothetical protein